KILDPGEKLRDWPVDGTVGYEFLNDVCGLFVDPAGEERLTSFWKRLADDPRPFSEWASEAKFEQATGPFQPEVERLLRQVTGVVPHMAESVSSLPVYRTYIRESVADEDREALAALPGDVRERLVPDSPFTTRFQQTTPAIMAKGVEDTAFYRY